MSNEQNKSRPLLVVLSAPSGAGKTTLATALLGKRSNLVRSVSCTTRKPRGSEADGTDYYFVSDTQFEARMAAGDFLEHAEVHGNRYGTLRKTVEDALRKNLSLLLVIDVQGAAQVRDHARKMKPQDVIRQGLVDIFVKPPSLEVLQERLEKRGEDSAETIEKRLKNAMEEMGRAKDFKYVIVNENLSEAVRELERILDHEAQKTK